MPATAVYSQNELPPGGQPRPSSRRGGQGLGSSRGKYRKPAGPGGATMPNAAFMQQVSYGLGRNFAMNLKDNEIEVDFQALMAGISDALRGAQPKWSEQQLETTLQAFGKQMQQKAMVRMQQQATKNKQEEAQFLAQNGR